MSADAMQQLIEAGKDAADKLECLRAKAALCDRMAEALREIEEGLAAALCDPKSSARAEARRANERARAILAELAKVQP